MRGLIKRGEEIGVLNLIDSIATEENGTAEDEVYAFLEQVGHPAPTMKRLKWGYRMPIAILL